MPDADAAVAESSRADAHVAVRNTLQLGASLFTTYGLGLAVRMFFLPRALGQEDYGLFTAADAAANVFLLLTTFGLETYTLKEVSVRPEHANEFIGGVTALRLAVAAVLTAVMSIYLFANGQSHELRFAALGLAGYYALWHHNNFLGAQLNAVRQVGGLAVANVTSKLLWAFGIVALVLLGLKVQGVVAAVVLSELTRGVLLYREAVRRLAVKMSVNVAGTVRALKASVPYLLNSVSLLYGKLDINMMSHWHLSAAELGWYGVAVQISTLTLLFAPLIGGAVLPLFSRAAARSPEELNATAARTMSIILTFATAGSFVMALGAELAVRLTAGETYAPAVPALIILCFNFVLTYVAVVAAYYLFATNRMWTMTGISMLGLLVNPIFNILLIRPLAVHGAGWAGTGAAAATVATELFVAGLLLALVGKAVFDRKSLSALARMVLSMALTLAAHTQLRVVVEAPPAWLGEPRSLSSLAVRLALDLVVFGALAVITKAVNVRETAEFVRTALRSRKQVAA